VIGQIGRKKGPLFLPRFTTTNILLSPEKLRYGTISLVFTTILSIQRQERIYLALEWT